MNNKSELIDAMLQSEDFQQCIDEGAPHRVKIMTEYADEMRALRDDFSHAMMQAEPSLRKIADTKAKERTDEEQLAYKTANKKFKQQFTSVKRIIHPNDKKNGEPQDPIGNLIAKLTNIVQLLVYIGKPDIIQRFKEAGIELKCKLLEEDQPALADKNVKEIITGIFNDADALQGKICMAADEIKINIYNKIDDSIRYSSKDPENKKGIKPSQFQKLVRTKAVALVKTPEEFTAFKEKVVAHDEDNLISQQGTLEKNKTI